MSETNGKTLTPEVVTSVLDMVCARRDLGNHWRREEIETALKRAMIPAQAPYADWADMVPRALTLLAHP